MHFSVQLIIYYAAIAMTPIGGGLALIKGGKPERYGAAVFVGGLILTDIYAAIAQHFGFWTATSLSDVDLISTFAISSCFLYLAVRYASLWLAAAMIVQASEIYFARAYLDTGVASHRLYGVELNLICISVLSLLSAGTIISWRARMTARRDEQKRADLVSRRREEQARRIESMFESPPRPAPVAPKRGGVARLIIEPPPL